MPLVNIDDRNNRFITKKPEDTGRVHGTVKTLELGKQRRIQIKHSGNGCNGSKGLMCRCVTQAT